MKPARPYIIRALYEWMLDTDKTPYLLVDATVAGSMIPTQFVEDGRIVLNISPNAVVSLEMNNNAVSFNARFAGKPMEVYVPMGAVLALYAREDGQGMGFGMEPGAEYYEEPEEIEAEKAPPAEQAVKPKAKTEKSKTVLKVIK